MSVRKTVQATAFNPERLMTLLLAPIVSEKATHIADKHNQVDLPRATRRHQGRGQGRGRAACGRTRRSKSSACRSST